MRLEKSTFDPVVFFQTLLMRYKEQEKKGFAEMFKKRIQNSSKNSEKNHIVGGQITDGIKIGR